MSIEAQNYVWNLTNLTPTKKLILLCLANFADIKNQSYPSYRYIAEKACLKDPKSVQRLIKELVESGLLKKQARYNKSKGQTSNLYTLTFAPHPLDAPPLSEVPTPTPPKHPNTKDDTKDIIYSEFEKFWKIYPRKISKHQAKLKYWVVTKTYDKDKLYDSLEKFVAHCEAEGTEQTYICHCSTWLNQKRYLDYEDIKLEDIKKVTKTSSNKPKWLHDKEVLSKQNEVRVANSWSTENRPKNSPKVDPKASKKLAEIAAKHNIKGKSR